MSGALYLVPTLLGDGADDVLPAATVNVARRIEHFLAENAKSARGFLKRIGHPRPLATLSIDEIGHEPDLARVPTWLAPLAAGHDVGLLSEAGCPGVADPGAEIVAAAHARGHRVVPLVGPSALLLALMAAGMNGQAFRFVGYLPREETALRQALRALEQRSATAGLETQLFIETPYRNLRLFETALAVCEPGTALVVATDLTLPAESIQRRSVAAWRALPASARPALDRRPTVFLLQAGRR